MEVNQMISKVHITELQDKKGQVVQSAAEIYESFFVPALFQQWSPVMVDMLDLSQQQRVLDVACGTGIVARHVAEQFNNHDQICGIDINEGMLEVAKQKAPGIRWQLAPAEALPFDNNSFDAVVCQFGLMFFRNRSAAIQEMLRVLKPGGKLALAVWDKIENSPGYKKVTELLHKLFGEKIANEMQAPFVLGDRKKLVQLMDDAGMKNYELQTVQGTAKFSSINDWVFTDIKGWTLADMIDAHQFEQLLTISDSELRQFTNDDGEVRFSAPAHIVLTQKNGF